MKVVSNNDIDLRFAEVVGKAKRIAEDRLINVAKSSDEVLTHKQLTTLVRGLGNDQKEILSGRVERYSGQLFGPMKYVIDWGEPTDTPLLDALYEIELFYRKNFPENP